MVCMGMYSSGSSNHIYVICIESDDGKFCHAYVTHSSNAFSNQFKNSYNNGGHVWTRQHGMDVHVSCFQVAMGHDLHSNFLPIALAPSNVLLNLASMEPPPIDPTPCVKY